MRWALLAVVLGTVACNALVGFDDFERAPAAPPPADDDDDDDLAPDASADATARGCDPTKPFAEPVKLGGPVNTVSSYQNAPTLTDDELTIVFSRAIGQLQGKLLTATRASIDQDFGAPKEIDVGGSAHSFSPTMTGDGLALFWSEYEDVQGDTIRRARILTARRASVDAAFGPPEAYREDAEPLAFSPHVSRDGTELFLSLPEADTIHLHRARRGFLGAYEAPTKLTELALDGVADGGVALTSDRLTLFFSSNRPGSAGVNDIWVTKRAAVESPFGAAKRVTELASPDADRPGWVSVDGCRLYMARGSEVTTIGAIYVATRPPR
ncbi:MAG: PD40 domain-containing protein [Labilithrix sp.]|nr:PD40 domain-containing protein [Labilithrix sp.]MCW5813660.1 PD40 domain-containing protein [Labilithrix sp.]